MPRTLPALLVVLLISACDPQDSVSFIPASPLTAAEIEQAREGLRNSPEFADLDADQVVEADDGLFTYRVEDIQQALQGIDPADELVSFCSSVVMDGATRLVLRAPAQADSVVVKWTSCSPVPGGLSCGSVNAAERAYYKHADNFFELEGNISSREANGVLALFENGGISGLPPELQRFDYTTVTAISKTAAGYRLEVGDRFCPACNTLLDVTVTAANELMLVGAPQERCN